MKTVAALLISALVSFPASACSLDDFRRSLEIDITSEDHGYSADAISAADGIATRYCLSEAIDKKDIVAIERFANELFMQSDGQNPTALFADIAVADRESDLRKIVKLVDEADEISNNEHDWSALATFLNGRLCKKYRIRSNFCSVTIDSPIKKSRLWLKIEQFFYEKNENPE